MTRFLWVTFQIFELSRENTDAGILKALASLPAGLYETYERILERIKKERKPDVARVIFQWLAVARRSLSLDEIAESTALEPGFLTRDKSCLPTNPFRLIEGCGNLVTHHMEDDSVRFAHSTVLEFLLSSPSSTPTPELFINQLEANLYVAQVCLAYLSLPDFQRQLSRIPKDRKVSAAGMAVADWVPSMVRGNRAGEFMWNVARYWRMPIQSDNVTAAACLPQPRPAPSTAAVLGKEYSLLNYVSTHWIYHCARLPMHDTPHWRIFAALVFERILPFTHLPWQQAGEDPTPQESSRGRNSDDCEVMLHWAAENRHLALFNLVIITMRSNGYTDKEIPVRRAWAVACRAGDVGCVSVMLSMDADAIFPLVSGRVS